VSQTLYTRVPDEVRARLGEYCEQNGVTLARAVTQILTDALWDRTCRICGCKVEDQDVHAEWHARGPW
jgi:hypothetical protein